MRELPVQILIATIISLAIVVPLEIMFQRKCEQQRVPGSAAEHVAQTFSELAAWMPQTEWAFCYRNGRLSWKSVCV